MKETAVTEKANGHNQRARIADEEAENVLFSNSLSLQLSFVETSALVSKTNEVDMYAAFKFERMHNFYLGISKLLKMCTFYRLNSYELFTCIEGRKRRSFKSVRNAILKGVNSVLAAFESDSYARALHVGFSTGESGRNLNGIFTVEGLQGMLEAKDYRALDMVFPFIGSYIDRCCNEGDEAPVTSIYLQYSDILVISMRYGMPQV